MEKPEVNDQLPDVAATTTTAKSSYGADAADEDGPDDFGPPLPPDGGWGWVIVIASFCCNFIVDGVCYTFGIFLPDLRDYFESGESQTVLVGSMLAGIYLIVGPFVSALANKFGCRKVTICGSVIASAFFIISIFSKSIAMMTFTYGVMGGIGFGAMYLPSIVMVGFYFDRKRALATGIAVCGSGIGTFVFAPLGSFLLESYGWRGANIILAGIILHGIVCGAVYRPLVARPTRAVDESKIIKSIVEQKKRLRTTSTGSLDGTVITRDNRLIKEQIALVSAVVDTIPEEDENHHTEDGEAQETREQRRSEAAEDAQNIPRNESFVTVGGSNVWSGSVGSIARRKQPRSADSRNKLYVSSNSVVRSVRSIRSAEEEERVEKRKKEMSSPFVRQDVMFPGSVTSLKEYKASADMASYVQSVTSMAVADEGTTSYPQGAGVCVKAATIVEQIFDFSLLKSATFFVVCMSGVFCFLGLYTPFYYLTAKAESLGIAKSDASLIISILGICNTCGRLLTGWLADRPWADSLVIHNGAVVAAGILTCAVPALNSYELLCTYAALFGISIAAFIALRSIVLVELLGIQKLTNAFGLTCLFQGIAILIGAPLSGAIYGATGSTTGSFLVSGSAFVLSGLVCLPARRLAAWEAKRIEVRKQKANQTEKA